MPNPIKPYFLGKLKSFKMWSADCLPSILSINHLSTTTREGPSSRKHAYIILTPLKPHFYIVKLGFTGVFIIFLISAQNIDCGYSLEPPRRGGSNEYPQYMFWAEIRKISEFLSENFQFLDVKFSIYLNRHVFVMYVICQQQRHRSALTKDQWDHSSS